MVDATEAMESQYLTAEMVKASPSKRAVFVSAGQYEETKYGNRLTLNVGIDGKTKTWRPNKDSVKNISAEFGKETKAWIGEACKLRVITQQGKDTVLAVPVPKQNVAEEAAQG